MIKKHIKTSSSSIRVSIPPEYKNRELNIVVFPVDAPESILEQRSTIDFNTFAGILSPDVASSLDVSISQARREWDRTF